MSSAADPRVAAWRALLAEKVAEFDAKEGVISWVWQDDVKARTGHPIDLEAQDALRAAIAPWQDRRDIIVDVEVSEYSGYEPYFVIKRRVMPPGISIG